MWEDEGHRGVDGCGMKGREGLMDVDRMKGREGLTDVG